MSQELNPQLSESEKAGLKESVHHLLKWAWRYNKNLEEQAAQLHMLTGWSQIVEVSWVYPHLLIFCVGWKILCDALICVYENQVAVSRRMSLFEERSQLLFE
jgi:nuclear pore complex protein Nup205